MNNNRDRAALTFTGSIPVDDFNRDVEVVATPNGLLIDEGMLIPWEWISYAVETLRRDGAEFSFLHPESDISSRE